MHINFPRSLLKCHCFFQLESPRSQPQYQNNFFFVSEHFLSIPPTRMSSLPLGPLSFSGVEVLTSDFSPASLARANCFSSRQYPFSMESYNQSDFTMWIFHFLANSYFGPEQKKFKNNFKNSTEKREFIKTKNVFKWKLGNCFCSINKVLLFIYFLV